MNQRDHHFLSYSQSIAVSCFFGMEKVFIGSFAFYAAYQLAIVHGLQLMGTGLDQLQFVKGFLRLCGDLQPRDVPFFSKVLVL